MKTFTKILAMVLAIATTAALSVGLTTAYLQDEDSDVNVMTLGNVQIEQIEQEWNADETALQDFTQAKPLYPFVGTPGWENTQEDGGAYRRFTMNNVVDKYVSVENTGKSDAYVRTIIALEMGGYTYKEFDEIGVSINKYDGSEFKFPNTWDWTDDFVAEIDGKNYNIMVAVHKAPVKPGETTIPSLLQVYMNKDATNEDCEKIDGNKNGTYDILVLSQAVQVAGFADAKTALDTAFGKSSEKAAEWFGGEEFDIPAIVSTADELKAAIANGGSIVLADDVELAKNETIVVASGTEVALNLNGHTLSAENTRTATHNFMIDVKGGTLSIENGTVSMKHTGSNMAWNGAATVIDVTAGGVLNLEGVTVKNEGGTDMSFCVHLNNWGEVTLNAKDCTFESIYVAIRVFNSGNDMNNVTIENSTLSGTSGAFWVHNFTVDDFKTMDKAQTQRALLNLDIFDNGNTYVGGYAYRYGFTGSVKLDATATAIPEVPTP